MVDIVVVTMMICNWNIPSSKCIITTCSSNYDIIIHVGNIFNGKPIDICDNIIKWLAHYRVSNCVAERSLISGHLIEELNVATWLVDKSFSPPPSVAIVVRGLNVLLAGTGTFAFWTAKLLSISPACCRALPFLWWYTLFKLRGGENACFSRDQDYQQMRPWKETHWLSNCL